MKSATIFVRAILKQYILERYGSVNKFCMQSKEFNQSDLSKFLNGVKDYKLEKVLRLLSTLEIDVQFLFHTDTTKHRISTFPQSPKIVNEDSYIQKYITIKD